MKHRKKLMILLTLTACMVLFCSFPVFAAELTEAQVEQAVAEQGKETVTGNVFVWFLLWSSIFVTLMANKIGGLQFGIYRNCQISSRVFHTAVAALPLTKANRSDFE